MGEHRGKLIVIEGADGVGKETQARLLYDRLRKEFPERVKISKPLGFPRYNLGVGAAIKHFLQNEISEHAPNDPDMMIELFYQDRKIAAMEKLKTTSHEEEPYALWERLKKGEIVLIDRYTGSSEGTQAAIIAKETNFDREKVDSKIKQIEDLERKSGFLPQEDIVIYLHIPFNLALQRMKDMGKNTDKYENDEILQEHARTIFKELCEKRDNWHLIDCHGQKEEGLTKEEVHNLIWNIVRPRIREE